MCSKSIGFILIILNFNCFAATHEQLDSIKTAAEQYVIDSFPAPEGGALTANSAEIDSRIKATDCELPLTASSQSRKLSSSITVLVQCESDKWRVYVPVKVSASQPLVVANRALMKGEVLTPADLRTEQIGLRSFRRFGFSTSELVVGAKLKRNIRLGAVIEQKDICVVCRNEKVIIKATKGELVITTKGTALSDATIGEQVRVKNDKSQRIIEGKVISVGEVAVQF